MKTISIEIPEGKGAKWVDGVLTLVDEQPVEFRFNYDDKVRFKWPYKELAIYRREAVNGKPHYWLKDEDGVPYPNHSEGEIEIYTEPQDITERIKTFEDACKWCKDNDKQGLYEQYADAINVGLQRAKDILAYLKLRIITCALNEGWMPRLYQNDMRYYAVMNDQCTDIVRVVAATATGASTPHTLYFKTKELALYAASQFKDIYIDLCKGKE